MESNFFNLVEKNLRKIKESQSEKINIVSKMFYETYKNNGLIYLFGTGHSHMLAEDGHFRAGGFAAICPILSTNIMLHEGASASSLTERKEGIASNILKKYNISSNDLLVIFSNSGVNQAPIEAALYAKDLNCPVIGVCSLKYSEVAPLSQYKKRLSELSNVFIDNYGPPGDALVEIKEGIKVSAFSTIAGSFILNSIIAEVAILATNDEPFPFYISSNMPRSKEHNEILFNKYKKRNPHL
tara:strand:- start:77 stop:799 length:723 start_codon:yes stop_codon:yes gene_type:complete